jgi:hypothetical protein
MANDAADAAAKSAAARMAVFMILSFAQANALIGRGVAPPL